jgi:regulator of replication initiation timing
MEFCPTERRITVHSPILAPWIRKLLAAVTIFTVGASPVCGQDALQDSIQNLQKQTSELKTMLEEMKAEMVRSLTETMALRKELEATRQQLAAAVPQPQGISSPANASNQSESQETQQSLQNLEEEQQLLSARIDEQYQTKVESASKYRVRLSGIALMNLFSNRHAVANIDFPSYVLQPGPSRLRGSFGGSLRQSQIGLEVFGPEIKGARVSANVDFDFAGGFPTTPDGVTFGLARLRSGVVRMDWSGTSLVAGQDAPFFSPLSPSSIASLALPALAYNGNLWTWIPQVRLERRLDLAENSTVLLQGGILDALTGEAPPLQFLRTPQAGEASRQPAYATRVAWSRTVSGRPLAVGVGGYYSRQNWGFDRNVDGWAGTLDWTLPAGGRLEFSGEFFRGRAIGGPGGGIGRSVLLSDVVGNPLTQVRGLNSMGGWAQAKFRQNETLEWNAAAGQETVFARDLRAFPLVQQTYVASLSRNRSAFVNFIYRPRSGLLFSAEYRRLQTFTIGGSVESADHINLGMGVLF